LRKPFEPDAYDQYDTAAKAAVRSYLDQKGHYTLIIENYGADILSYRPIKHEVEVKAVWKNGWPSCWDTVQIPERKKRLLKHGKVIFWVLRADCKKGWIIDGSLLKADRLKEVSNNKIKAGERFFCIPVDECVLVNL